MSSVIDLRTYVGASSGRLLVMVDLQEKNYDALAKDHARDLDARRWTTAWPRSGMRAISAFRSRSRGRREGPGVIREIGASRPGFPVSSRERSDMVFERQQPSCYSNQLFENVVSQAGSFAIAGLVAEETCLATAIDASRRGHQRHVPERCICESLRGPIPTPPPCTWWPRMPSNFLPMSPTPATGWSRRRSDLSKGIAMDELSARRLRNVHSGAGGATQYPDCGRRLLCRPSGRSRDHAIAPDAARDFRRRIVRILQRAQRRSRQRRTDGLIDPGVSDAGTQVDHPGGVVRGARGHRLPVPIDRVGDQSL